MKKDDEQQWDEEEIILPIRDILIINGKRIILWNN